MDDDRPSTSRPITKTEESEFEDMKSTLEELFGVTIKLDVQQNFDFFRYKPELICWRNKLVETIDFADASTTDQYNRTNSVNANGENNPNSVFTLENLIKSIQNVGSLELESLSSIEYITHLICSSSIDEEVQAEITDFLGFENIELVENIMKNRNMLAEELKKKTKEQKNSRPKGLSSPSSSAMLKSRREIIEQRKLEKDERRYKKDVEKFIESKEPHEKKRIQLSLHDKLEKEKNEREFAYKKFLGASAYSPQSLPYVFDSSKNATLKTETAQFTVPEGSNVYNDKNGLYEEIFIPPPTEQQHEIPKGFERIYISSLDQIGQTAFQGFESLNIVQSVVFEKAYKTLENLLICAPTGAGKTNIALLAMLKTIRDNCRLPENKINTSAFKIVYIAPMKALASEMTANFTKRLGKLGIKVQEVTGDTHLSRREVDNTQILVLTPEKWDAMTRKGDDETLFQRVRLIIIDEIHLLQDDRGPVIEAIVARTFRQNEVYNLNTRLVALSATLPNYIDVANFLHVNPTRGLFFFDNRFRPVPLAQSFVGVHLGKVAKDRDKDKLVDKVCYEKCIRFLRGNHQVLIFVHSRNATKQLANTFIEISTVLGDNELFKPGATAKSSYLSSKNIMRSGKSAELQRLYQNGIGIHHAGMERHDRNLMEKMFSEGAIRVLICTATLAWGVNLPAKAVIIRGTKIFDFQRGAFEDIGILDVQQIFGRAGRPQFQDSGHATIITSSSDHHKYIKKLTRQSDITSKLQFRLFDHLNAEISKGTISNLTEAVEWLKYTYFYVRLKRNPIECGINWSELGSNPELAIDLFLYDICRDAAIKLDRNKMVRFDQTNEFLNSTNMGRIASNYYIRFETIEILNETDGPVIFSSQMNDEQIINLIAMADEFSQIKPRESEVEQLEFISNSCPLPIRQGLATVPGKVNCLLQYHITRMFLDDFVLASELFYISQNATRIARSLFEIALRRCWTGTTVACLNISKFIEQRSFNSPIRHLLDIGCIGMDTLNRIEGRIDYDHLMEMNEQDLGKFYRCDGKKLYEGLRMLPIVELEARIKPLTKTIIQIDALITPTFTWNNKLHGSNAQKFWIFVEDSEDNMILHYEQFVLTKKMVINNEPQRLIFTIPIHESQTRHNYHFRISSDSFVVKDIVVPLTLTHCPLPTAIRPHTDLLDLDPVPITILKNEGYQKFYSFKLLNPVQTQVFHVLYQTDENVLIGAPTSSGKTLCAELAIFRLFNKHPGKKCVYVAPLKALVHERMNDWERKFKNILGISVVEISGDSTPDYSELSKASILITTPEKWDGITRSHESFPRRYVREVELMIIDEIHLLGVERGAVIEAIITRIKMIARRREMTSRQIRIIGLSTALANAGDVAEWIGIKDHALFNFRPNVRPVPIQVFVQGFPGQHYCPRMASMNKPAFKAIRQFSPQKLVLVFVASRRQTIVTALAFVSMLQKETDPNQWLGMDQQELERIIKSTVDENLRVTLPHGIGMHHAGLNHSERTLVEKLFVEKKIQILIATSTLAWGINVPAHLVIVKGTEYFDGKTHKYVDFPVTDVLQMIGRAGRPQFDNSAVAIVYVQEIKTNYYKRFLYEPFPIESNLLPTLPNHINAEICAGTIMIKQHIAEYLAGTYLYRRLFANPAYYGIEQLSDQELASYLTTTADKCIVELIDSSCLVVDEEGAELHATPFGRIASRYYNEHLTIRHFKEKMKGAMTVEELLQCLVDCPEYAEIPVRHNEDEINKELQASLPIKFPLSSNWQSSHIKTHLLYQAHFSNFRFPPRFIDYKTDQRSILESCVRIIQAMVDFAFEFRWLDTMLNVLIILQQVFQGNWYYCHPLLLLPDLNKCSIEKLGKELTIPLLQNMLEIYMQNEISNLQKQKASKVLASKSGLDEKEAREVVNVLLRMPQIQIFELSLQSETQQEILFDLSNPYNVNDPQNLSSGTDYTLVIKLRVFQHSSGEAAYCPRYSKKRTASWIILLGDCTRNRIEGITKIHNPSTSIYRIPFTTPTECGPHNLKLFLFSDTYMGIDQEYEVKFHISC